MDEEKKLFASNVTYDEAFFKENAHYMLAAGFYRKRLILLAVVAVIVLLAYAYTRMTTMLILLAAYVVLWFVLHFRYRNSVVRQQIKRLKESTPEGKIEMQASCCDEGVRIENFTTGGSMVFQYADLATFAETDRWLMVYTKASQFFTFDKTNIADGGVEALLAYLHEKCPQLTRRR